MAVIQKIILNKFNFPSILQPLQLTGIYGFILLHSLMTGLLWHYLFTMKTQIGIESSGQNRTYAFHITIENLHLTQLIFPKEDTSDFRYFDAVSSRIYDGKFTFEAGKNESEIVFIQLTYFLYS
jgi:hypothetical protein